MSWAAALILQALLVLLLGSTVRSWGEEKSGSRGLQVERAPLISYTHYPHSTIPNHAGDSSLPTRLPSKPLGMPLVPVVDPSHGVFGPSRPVRDYTAARKAAIFAKHLRNFELTRKEEYQELIAKGYKKRKNGDTFFTNNNQLPLTYGGLGSQPRPRFRTPIQNNIVAPNVRTISSVSGDTPAVLTPTGRGRIVYFSRRPSRGFAAGRLSPRLRQQPYTAPSTSGGWK